jgi:hypothetical protein
MGLDIKDYIDYDPEAGILTRKKKYSIYSNYKIGDVLRTTNGNGYIHFYLANKNYLGHRVAWYLYHGEWPKDQIDHVDHDATNNKIKNLRAATQSENNMNRGLFSRIHCLPKGVYLTTSKASPYKSSIRLNKKFIHLGYFKTVEEASEAYEDAAENLFKEFYSGSD